jgi:hypothetical protein
MKRFSIPAAIQSFDSYFREQPIGDHFRGDDAPLRAGENEVIAGGVDSPFVFSVFVP